MAKKSVAELDFDFSEDGELELTGFGEDDEFIEDDELVDEEEELEEEEEEVEEEDATTVTVRLSNLEKTIQSLPQMIATSIASALNKTATTTAKQEEEEEEIPDELDNKQIVNILAKRMQKSVKETVSSAVKEMHESDPAVREARMTAAFRQCQQTYGQKFTDRMIPVAKIVYASKYTMSPEDAYLSIADMPVPSSVKTKPGQKTVAKKAVRVDADSRDSIGSVEKPARPKFDSKRIKETTDADMFQHAWNSALMSAARSGSRRRA